MSDPRNEPESATDPGDEPEPATDLGDGRESADHPDTSGTVCPFCAVGCRLAHEGNRVRGRPGPANPDARLCRKGLQAFDPVDDPERLTEPMVREDGELVAVPWERALDRVASAFESVVERYGPHALAFLGAPRCTNEENYLLEKLARTLGTNNVDNRARLCHAATARRLEARLGWPAMTNTLADIGRADAFLVVGANPAARQPVAFNSAVRPAVNGGATLVHVDPRENETTRTARVHLAPRPGTDAVVVTALCSLLVEAGAVDEDFVTERTTGFDRFRASMAGVHPASAAETADVDEQRLREVARTLGEADRVAVLTGTGGDDAATADALLNLLLLTGSLGRPGTGLNMLRGLNNEQGAVDVGCVPDRLPGHRPLADAAARERLETEWGHPVPSQPGDTEHDLLRAFGDGVYGALVVGENPAVSKFDPEWTDERLDGLDTLVVQDPYPNETTAHADVVLPAAAGVEKPGTVTNMDRQVQRLRPAADPPGEARQDLDTLSELGTRLVGETFDYDGPAEVFAEIARVTPIYSDISSEGLFERSRRWPTEGDGAPGSEGILYRESFETADGRARFVPMDASADANAGDGQAGLRLVVGDRVGSFTGEEDESVDRRVTVHPDDAGERGVEDGDPVVVSNDAATVETTALVSEAVRPGTVYLHAGVADPLVRGGGVTVSLRPLSSG